MVRRFCAILQKPVWKKRTNTIPMIFENHTSYIVRRHSDTEKNSVTEVRFFQNLTKNCQIHLHFFFQGSNKSRFSIKFSIFKWGIKPISWNIFIMSRKSMNSWLFIYEKIQIKISSKCFVTWFSFFLLLLQFTYPNQHFESGVEFNVSKYLTVYFTLSR